MGSEKYKSYIIKLLIQMGFCYEVKKVYGIETIKKEYTSLFTPIFNFSLGIFSKGDNFLINIELFKLYKNDNLSLRDMEKEIFLVNDKLSFLSKSSIQRLSVKVKNFNEDDYHKENLSKIHIGFGATSDDRLKTIIKNVEHTINYSNYYQEIAKGKVSKIKKSYHSFIFNKEKFKKLLKKEHVKRLWHDFVANEYSNKEHEELVLYVITDLIRKSLTLASITETLEGFYILGGEYLYQKAIDSYIEYFLKEHNLNEIGIINFDKKIIKT